MKSIFLSTTYLHDCSVNEIELVAIYKPYMPIHRQLYFEIVDTADVECMEYECDPRELFKKMNSLGYAKALEAIEFQYYELEDEFPGYFISIKESGDMYSIQYVANSDSSYHYISKHKFDFFLERLCRLLKQLVCGDKNAIEFQETKYISSQNCLKYALDKYNITSEFKYLERYYDDFSKTEYKIKLVLYPKTCSCSIFLDVGSFENSYSTTPVEYSCNIYMLMGALEKQDKVSTIESMDWFLKVSDTFVQLKLSDECSFVAECYDVNGFSRHIYIINKEKLLCFLDNVYNILK